MHTQSVALVRSPAAEAPSVRDLVAAHRLTPNFQPVARLADGSIVAHEALIRTPPGSVWPNPDALFSAARAEGVLIALEIECVRLSLMAWSASASRGQLFVNLSAEALVTALAQRDLDSILTVSARHHPVPGGLVIELTEHERVGNIEALNHAVQHLRRHKIAIALDDFGDGRSSLRLWSELKPEVVKIDKYFTRDLRNHPEKVQTLRALMQISHTLGAQLVAEGIETGEDLHLVRGLGVPMGQGWHLGRPATEPATEVPPEARAVIASRDVAILPERRRVSQQRASARTLMHEAESVTSETTNEELYERFASNDALRAMAIVDQGRPVGIVGRQGFVDRYAKPYFREIYGRGSCTLFANLAPRIVDVHAGIDELTELLTSEDQRYLSEGIVITEHGRYRGLASGEDLVRSVTESRIEAARHANPLSLLPGNIPITQHIQRLLAAEREFVACYADLNQFKPFNDIYRYWRGDQMILLTARCLTQAADPRRDFVGHVGGDDFVILFQSDDWERRCRDAVDRFNEAARQLYDEEARNQGDVSAEDRHGVVRFFPLTTLSVGAVRVDRSSLAAEDVANAAAEAKRNCKLKGLGFFLLDWRPPLSGA